MLLKSLWFRLESLWCRFIIGDVELSMVTNNMSELQYDFQKYNWIIEWVYSPRPSNTIWNIGFFIIGQWFWVFQVAPCL